MVSTEFILRMISLVIVALLISVSNLLIISVIFFTQSIPYNMKYLVLSMCLSDMMVGFALTLSIITAGYDRWIFGYQMCAIVSTIWAVAFAITLNTLTCMVIDRYIVVMYPMSYTRIVTKSRITFCIVFIWFFTISSTLGYSLIQQIRYVYVSYTYTCVINFENTSTSKLLIVLSVFLCAIPNFLTSASCNIQIYRISLAHKQRVYDVRDNGKRKLVNVKGLKTIMIATAVSTICIAPGLISSIAFWMDSPLPTPSHNVQFIIHIFTLSHSYCNWIVYTTTNPLYGKAQKDIWKRIKGKFVNY